MMDKYSRLLIHFSTVTGSNNEQESYPNFVKELAVLESPSSELCRIIKEDLPTILPAVLILSVHDDVSVRSAVSKTFDTFCGILKTHPSVKNESWWKDMEDKLIAQHYSSKLVKMVEKNDEPWAKNWVFVINLIVVNSEQVHGVAINSLLKVVETAFKMSKKNDQIMEKAYFCWNQLIDIFSVHPRVSVSQKLVELFVRPLSTTHLSLKCPELKMETWNNLMRKIAFSCGNKCKYIIEPFIDYMFMKGEDSLSANFPNDSLQSFLEIVQQKKLYKHFAAKILPIFPKCYERADGEDLENLVIKIWTCLLENITDVNKDLRNGYILDIFLKFCQVSQMNKLELNKKLSDVFVEKNIFTIDHLRTCLDSSEVSFVQMFSVFLKYKNFREKSFSSVVKNLLDGFPESNNKQQNNIDLEIWDILCDSYVLWIKSVEKVELSGADSETLSSLLMVPFVYKQWSVGAVQKTWYALVDAVLSTVSANAFLFSLFNKLTSAVKSSQIPVGTCIEIFTHITDKDKSVFKLIMPTLNVTSQHVSPKEPKPLMDLLILLENSMNYIPKVELTSFFKELMADANKYEHPWGIRIKTKCSKLQRKLIMVKESTEDTEEKHSLASEEIDMPSGAKTRSPVMAQSNFLHRLAKAEEKKKKKVPTHASVFGEPSPTGKSTSSLVGKPESSEHLSPLQNSTVPPCQSIEGNSPGGEASGRVTPVIPTAVTVITPTRARRSTSRSPDPNSAKSKRQILPKVAAAPPKYFDESAQEDFVIIPPKERNTPLTEHQKEMLSKRRSDIPALYQDLSQDTQSESQSIKEINFHQLLKPSEKEKDLSLDKAENNISVKVAQNLDKPNSDNSLGQKQSGDLPLAEEDKPKVSESSDDSKIYSVDMFAHVTNSEIVNVSKTSQDSSKLFNEESEKTPSTTVKSIDIVENSQPNDSIVSYNLTPTKQPGPPTPRNLVSKLNLIEAIEEEEELEKENKILNAKLVSSDKTSVTPIKRRSTRKSTGKFSTKNVEENKEIKTKPKKDSIEIPKIIVDSPDSLSENSSVQNDCHDSSVKNLVKINATPPKSVPEFVSVMPSSQSENVSKSDVQQINEPMETNSAKDKGTSDKLLVAEQDNSSEVKSCENGPKDPKTSDLPSSLSNSPNSNESNNISNKNLDDTFTIIGVDGIQNATTLTNTDDSDRSEGSVLSQENSESPTAVVGSWAMTSSVSNKTKSRKKKSIENPSQYSPKQLRSKRLSLTKNQEGGESAKKKIRESLPNKSITTKIKNIDSSDESESVANVVEEADNNKDKGSEKKIISTIPLKIDLTPNRKRRLVNGYNNEIEEKKKKKDEDISQDSMLVVKNNLTWKPRKKKVIKSNVKISPNNLEQWLIKSGKLVVKTSLISQENSHSETESSKMIEDSSDIHINVSESKNIVVEKIEPSTPPNETTSLQKDSDMSSDDNLDKSICMETDQSPSKGESEGEEMEVQHGEVDLLDSKEDLLELQNCTLVSDEEGAGPLQSSSSEEEVALEGVKCGETELPGTPEIDVREMYLKRRRLLKREGTPARELPPSESDEKGTPTRTHRPGRSAQMVMMATSEEEPQIRTPVRKRPSIQHFSKTENWPEGRLEPWVPCLPTPPGISPSLGILKKKAVISTPTNSPTTSPQVRRKRVSFLDPVVFSGLMYAKGCSEPKGEVQYAVIPPGKNPVCNANEKEEEEECMKANQEETNESSTGSATSEPAESVDELTAIQEFLKSTPDAPWSSNVPPELDLMSVSELESCTEPIDELLKNICFNDKEKFIEASNELERLNVKTVAGLRLLQLADVGKFCEKYLGAKSLVAIIEEFLQEKKTRNKKADISEVATLTDDMRPAENAVVSTNTEENELQGTNRNVKPKRSHRSCKPSIEVYEEKIELIEEQIITVNVCKKGTQTLLQVDPKKNWPLPEMLPSTSQKNEQFIDKDLTDSIISRLPHLLNNTQFCTALTSQIKELPEEKFDNLIKVLFDGIAEKRGLGCISLAVNLLQNMQKELENNPH